MKKALVALAIALPFHVSASEMCETMGKLAEVIMEERQEGAKMRDMYSIVNTEIGKGLIREAFKEPRYSTQEMRDRAIVDFGNDVYRECISSMNQ